MGDGVEFVGAFFGKEALTQLSLSNGGLSARMSRGRIGVEYASCNREREGVLTMSDPTLNYWGGVDFM